MNIVLGLGLPDLMILSITVRIQTGSRKGSQESLDAALYTATTSHAASRHLGQEHVSCSMAGIVYPISRYAKPATCRSRPIRQSILHQTASRDSVSDLQEYLWKSYCPFLPGVLPRTPEMGAISLRLSHTGIGISSERRPLL
jgi:hypothetical protein